MICDLRPHYRVHCCASVKPALPLGSRPTFRASFRAYFGGTAHFVETQCLGRPVAVRAVQTVADILLKISREFGKSIEWLLTGKEQKQLAENEGRAKR